MLKRNSKNPVVSRENIPDIPPHLIDVSSVFNPGAIKFDGKYSSSACSEQGKRNIHYENGK
jgi:predicted GH43/DUF377 family glycosyl hydrolase